MTDAVFQETAAWAVRVDLRRALMVLRKEDLTSAEARQCAPRALGSLFG